MAKFVTLSADNPYDLCDQVGQLIKFRQAASTSVQVVPLTVPDPNSPTGSRMIFQAFITM